MTSFDISTVSPELLQQLLQQAAQQSVSVPAEYTGNGGIKFSTAGRIRNGLWSRTGYDENVTVSLHNGLVVSLLMLKTTKRWADPRPSDGKRGQDYYLIWELSEDVGNKVATYLEGFPEAPKQGRSGGNRSGGNGGQQSGGLTIADVQALIAQAQQTPVPTAPIAPAAGHVQVPSFSAAPVATPVVAEQDIPTVFPGQAIRCGLTGEVRYVSDAGIVRTVKNPVS